MQLLQQEPLGCEVEVELSLDLPLEVEVPEEQEGPSLVVVVVGALIWIHQVLVVEVVLHLALGLHLEGLPLALVVERELVAEDQSSWAD